jgi:hypothetical protein
MKSIINALEVKCKNIQTDMKKMERRHQDIRTAIQLITEENVKSQDLDPEDLASVRSAICRACNENNGSRMARSDLMTHLPGVSESMFSTAVSTRIRGVHTSGVRAGRRYVSSLKGSDS